jgi:hypothetical protein
MGLPRTDTIYDLNGLDIDVELAGQPTNPDPRHPDPVTVLKDAFQYAGIGVNGGYGAADRGRYAIFITVGHMPRGLRYEEPLLRKFGNWLRRLD